MSTDDQKNRAVSLDGNKRAEIIRELRMLRSEVPSSDPDDPRHSNPYGELMWRSANHLDFLLTALDAAEQALATANKRIEKARQIVEPYKNELRRLVNLGLAGPNAHRLNECEAWLAADDAASKENPK